MANMTCSLARNGLYMDQQGLHRDQFGLWFVRYSTCVCFGLKYGLCDLYDLIRHALHYFAFIVSRPCVVYMTYAKVSITYIYGLCDLLYGLHGLY